MPPTVKTAALTGATGFIGSAIRKRLLAEGWKVRALRRPGGPVRETGRSLRWITGSLEDRKSLARLVQESPVVIHCAGTVRGATEEDFTRTNVLGTNALLDSCLDLKERFHFILISSLAAREPGLSFYAASKRQSEEAVTKRLAEGSWTIIRPPAVYGPGDRELLPLFRIMSRGICPVPGSSSNRVSLIHVQDISGAVATLCNQSKPYNKIYELHDGKDGGYTWTEVARTVSAITGHGVMPIKIPASIVKITGLVNIWISLITGGKPMLTPGKARELLHPDWSADNRHISEDTGWRPAILLKAGLRQLLCSG